MASKNYDGWALYDHNGSVWIEFISSTRTDVIEKFRTSDETYEEAKSQIKEFGYSVRKIRIVEVE